MNAYAYEMQQKFDEFYGLKSEAKESFMGKRYLLQYISNGKKLFGITIFESSTGWTFGGITHNTEIPNFDD